MEKMDIDQQLRLVQKQVEAAVSVNEETKLNLLAAIDGIRIELEVLKRFLAHGHPDFARQYAALKEAVIQEVDPEWVEPHPQTKKS